MDTDKVAVVTGGAEGIGKAASGVLLKLGYKVGILDINETLGKQTVEEFCNKFGSGSCVSYKCDVTDSQQLKDCFDSTEKQFGKVNMVVNNAGILSEHNWAKMVDINLKSMIDMTYIAVDKMRKDKGGNGGIIVNVASLAGLITWSGFPVYTATKWAVLGFTKCLQGSLNLATEDWGISLLNLCPSFVRTTMASNASKGNFLGSVSPHVPQEPVGKRVREGVAAAGTISVDEVAEAFEQLVLENKAGSALLVQRVDGEAKSMYVERPWQSVEDEPKQIVEPGGTPPK